MPPKKKKEEAPAPSETPSVVSEAPVKEEPKKGKKGDAKPAAEEVDAPATVADGGEKKKHHHHHKKGEPKETVKVLKETGGEEYLGAEMKLMTVTTAVPGDGPDGAKGATKSDKEKGGTGGGEDAPPPKRKSVKEGEMPKKINFDDIDEIAYMLEEPEVLPYESVFDWEIQDPIGFYRDGKRYETLRTKFNTDPIKCEILEAMWRDRIKYQSARRFKWPPELLFNQVFAGRGYYPDHNSRPGVNLGALALKENPMRRKYEIRMKLARDNRMVLKPWIDEMWEILRKRGRKPEWKKVIYGQKHSLSDFDPRFYNRHILKITDLPKGTTRSFLERFFPKAKMITNKNKDNGMVDTEMVFETEADAAEAFRKAIRSDINGEPINILPKKRKFGANGEEEEDQRQSLSEFDPRYFDRTILQIRKLPKTVTREFLVDFFVKGKLGKIIDNGKGTNDVDVEFKNEDDAAAAFKKFLDSLLNKKPTSIFAKMRGMNDLRGAGTGGAGAPIKKPPKPKPPPPPKYEAPTAVFSNMSNLWVGGKKPPPPSKPPPPKVPKVIPFNEKFQGGGVGQGTKLQGPGDLDFDKGGDRDDWALAWKDGDNKSKPKTTKTLKSYNPLEYNYLKLEVKNIPPGTDMQKIKKMFPKGKVSGLQPDPDTGFVKVVVTFDKEADAIEAYTDSHEQPINGNTTNIVPLPKTEADEKKGKAKKGKKGDDLEVVEEVTYETMPKKKHHKKKDAAPEVIEEQTTYEVLKKPKKGK